MSGLPASYGRDVRKKGAGREHVSWKLINRRSVALLNAQKNRVI